MKMSPRHIVFIIIALAVILPIMFNIRLGGSVTPETQQTFDNIDSLAPGSVIMVSFDFEASSLAEVRPLAEVIIRHAIAKNLRIAAVSLFVEGAELGRQLLTSLAGSSGKVYGVDYVYLGFRPQFQAAILAMGESISREFPVDYFGNVTADLPMMREVDNYSDIALIVSVADGSMPTYWVEYAVTPHRAKFQTVLTATMATSFYPYLASGQIKGIAAGLKGAAEYESLLGHEGAGSRGALAQSVSQFAIVLIIIAGNLIERWRRRRD
ncbi:MAG: hypothetical protein WBP42_10660 [Candidatus Zixiibacteriota bacterium]